MTFILSKVLSFLFNPLTWVFILLGIAIYRTQAKSNKRFLIGATLLLYLFSNAFIFHSINSAWEVKPINTAKFDTKYEVAIVLGGVASFDRNNQQIEFHANSGRILNILPLYFSGKVEKILLSGGSGKLIPEETEASILAAYLIEIGVKEGDILIEEQSRNTYENALYSKQLLEEHNIHGNLLLSTSAIHMNRAYACFQKAGMEVSPFSADQISYNRNYYFDTLFIPNTNVLQYWYQLIHEWIGMLSYQLMGRV